MYKSIPCCRLCGAKAEKQSVKCDKIYEGTPEHKFWQCAICDAIYLFPITSGEEDTLFYENEFAKWMVKRSGDDAWTDPGKQLLKMKKIELPLRSPWINKLIKPGMKVLEIGSSSGFILQYIQELGGDCIGVELSPEYAAYANSLGLKTYRNLDELKKSGNTLFDLVLHYNVLEHVIDPLEFLKECLNYATPGGKIMFDVPNANDPLSSLYKIPAFHAFYWWRAHHWYFTPNSLRYLLDKLKLPYEIYPGQKYDLSNHIHWMLTGQPGGMGKYSHIFSKETEQSYAEDLKQCWLCDYMIAIVSC